MSKANANSEAPNLFWTEGTIDAIEIDATDAAIRFRLVPSAAFLVETDFGARMLFKKNKPNAGKVRKKQAKPKEDLPLDAKLVRCGKKDQEEKKGRWFRWTNNGHGISGLLLDAKNARTTIRLGVPDSVFTANPANWTEATYTVSKMMFV